MKVRIVDNDVFSYPLIMLRGSSACHFRKYDGLLLQHYHSGYLSRQCLSVNASYYHGSSYKAHARRNYRKYIPLHICGDRHGLDSAHTSYIGLRILEKVRSTSMLLHI